MGKIVHLIALSFNKEKRLDISVVLFRSFWLSFFRFVCFFEVLFFTFHHLFCDFFHTFPCCCESLSAKNEIFSFFNWGFLEILLLFQWFSQRKSPFFLSQNSILLLFLPHFLRQNFISNRREKGRKTRERKERIYRELRIQLRKFVLNRTELLKQCPQMWFCSMISWASYWFFND